MKRNTQSVKAAVAISKVCPDCGVDGCAVMETLDGSQAHLICMDCNRVYAKSLGLPQRWQWKDLGPFVRV